MLEGILLQRHIDHGLQIDEDYQMGPYLLMDGKIVASFGKKATPESIRMEADRIVDEIASGEQKPVPACFDCCHGYRGKRYAN